HRTTPRLERRRRDCLAGQTAWLAQAALHELRGVGARPSNRTARSVFGESDHPPSPHLRPRGLRALRHLECLRCEDLSELRAASSPQDPRPRTQAPLRARPFSRLRVVVRAGGATALRMASEAARGELAIERSSEARTGMLEAAHQQPSRVDTAEV